MLERSSRAMRLALLAAGLPLFVTASWARPAAQQSESMPFSVSGRIVKAEPGKITVGTGENIVFYVRYNQSTKIMRADGSAAEANDLREGIHVSVKGTLDEEGDVIAKTIQIEQAKDNGGKSS